MLGKWKSLIGKLGSVFASTEGAFARRKLTDPDTILGTHRLTGLPDPRFWLLVRDSAGEVHDPVLVFTAWHRVAPRVVGPGVAHRRENLAPLSLVFAFASKKKQIPLLKGEHSSSIFSDLGFGSTGQQRNRKACTATESHRLSFLRKVQVGSQSKLWRCF